MVHFRGKNLCAKCIFNLLFESQRINKEEHKEAIKICETKPTWEYEFWMQNLLLEWEKQQQIKNGQIPYDELTYWPPLFESLLNFYVTSVKGYVT